jgi:hypothetical protein
MASVVWFSCPVAYAGIQADFDRELLDLSKAEPRYTNTQKLVEQRCDMIKRYIDTDSSVMRQAMGYSCGGDELAIGVALLAGKDLGKHSPEKVAQHFEGLLLKQKMSSKVFIQHGYEHGTSLVFFVNGSSYYANYINPVKAMESLNGLVADVRLMYFKSGQITAEQLTQWIKSAPTVSD